MTITDFQWVHLGKPGAYLIENDGTDSTLHYSATFPDAGATWVDTAITGVYTKIRVGSTSGQVYIMGTTDEGVPCPLDGWSVSGTDGTEIDRDDDYITVEASFNGAQYQAAIVSSSVSGDCCEFSDIVALVGTLGVGVFGFCGEAFDTYLNGGYPTGGQSVNQILVASLSPVTVKFTSGGSTITAVVTRYSDDYGETFETVQIAGSAPGVFSGVDTAKVGSVILVGTSGQVMKATAGGAYAPYGSALPAGFVPACIWIPRYQFTSSSVLNNATNPEYLVASNVEDDDGESLYRVTAGGSTWFAISPTIGADKGLAVSADCLGMPFKSGKRISAVLDFDGDTHLVTSVSTGGAWADRDVILGALSVRYRRGDSSLQQLYISTQGGLCVSINHGALLQTRLSPGPTPLLGCEPFG